MMLVYKYTFKIPIIQKLWTTKTRVKHAYYYLLKEGNINSIKHFKLFDSKVKIIKLSLVLILTNLVIEGMLQICSWCH